VFLRNEPTVLADIVLCIARLSRYLYRLQTRFAGGFVLENEPRGSMRSFSLESGFVYEKANAKMGDIWWKEVKV
jgi:hypothetical protein